MELSNKPKHAHPGSYATEMDYITPELGHAAPIPTNKHLVSPNSSTLHLNPDDPLLWSHCRKVTSLAAICYLTILTDFLAGYAVPMTVPQAKEWDISVVDAGRNLSGNTFMQGFGSIFAVPLCMRFGIIPVMFWMGVATVGFTIGCAAVDNWIGYIAFRVGQGFFAAPAQVLGMTMIQEMFGFKEHVGMVGVWGWALLVGPYGGPLISSFVLRSLTWRESWWMMVGCVGFGVLLVVFFMEETAFDRISPSNNPVRPANWLVYRAQLLTGAFGYRAKGRPKLSQGCAQLWTVFKQPHFYVLFIYHGISYMWSIGINGTLINFLVPPRPAGYGFSTTGVGLIYFAPITGIIMGEFVGHFVNNAIQAFVLRRNNGLFIPETRLWALYPCVIIEPVALALLGFALKGLWHWGAVAFFWGFYIFACMISTVAISSYVLDCFPDATAPSSALLNFCRVVFGFLVPWFQGPWSKNVGAHWSFTTQGLICVAAFVLVPVVQWKGKQWRKRTSFQPEAIQTKAIP